LLQPFKIACKSTAHRGGMSALAHLHASSSQKELYGSVHRRHAMLILLSHDLPPSSNIGRL
jgi:hypothetical protein